MPGEYKKILRLASKSTVDFSASALEKGGAGGHNWHVDPATGDVTKRAGLVPCAAMPATDEDTYSWVWSGTSEVYPFLGSLGAASYTPSLEISSNSWDTEALGGVDWNTYRTEQEAVFVASGRLHSLISVPAFLATGTGTLSYSFWPDSYTGNLIFTLYDDEAAVASYTVTSTSTIADVATAMSGTVFANFGQAALPAYCIAQKERGASTDQITGKLVVRCFVTYAAPNAFNIGANTARSRIFSTSSGFAFDTPVQMVQYNEWLLLAGQKDGLYAYDGFRTRRAGVESPVVETSKVAAGSLTGTYTWLFRTKYVSPSGVISYGPTTTVTDTLAAEDLLITVSSSVDAHYINGARDIAQPMVSTGFTIAAGGTGEFTLDTASYAEDPLPQPNETLFFEPTVSSNQAKQVLTYDPATGLVDLAFGATINGTAASANERLEIYRNVSGGTIYYLVDEIPNAFGSTYTDDTSDGVLDNQDVLIETAFTPIPTPLQVAAVTVHQNRAVIIAEDTTARQQKRIATVYYTEPNTLEFTADNSFTVDLVNGEELVACYSHDGALYLASNLGVWTVSGDMSSATSFTVSRVPNGQGAVSNCAVAGLRSSMFMLSRFGLFTTVGASADYQVGLPINGLIKGVSADTLSRARLCADESAGRLYVVLPGVSLSPVANIPSASLTFYGNYQGTMQRFQETTEETSVLCYDVDRGAWYKYQPATPVSGGCTVVGSRVVFFPKRHDAPIVELNDAYKKDAWTAIDMEFATPWEDAEDPTTSKNFPRLQLLSTGEGSQNFSLDVTTETDWSANLARASFDVGFLDGDGYGEVPYATDVYGDPNVADHVEPLTNIKAKSCRLVLRNDDPAEKPTISGWVIEVAANSRNAKET